MRFLSKSRTHAMGIFQSLTLKGVVCKSNPIHFLSNSANISSRSAGCPFCVCAEKNVRCSYTALKQTEWLGPSHHLMLVYRTTLMLCRRIICVYLGLNTTRKYSPLHSPLHLFLWSCFSMSGSPFSLCTHERIPLINRWQ